MTVHIKRKTLFAEVTIITKEGMRLIATMSRDVLKTDERIKKLKSQLVHMKIKED